jgi:hypothetical protein
MYSYKRKERKNGQPNENQYYLSPEYENHLPRVSKR